MYKKCSNDGNLEESRDIFCKGYKKKNDGTEI